MFFITKVPLDKRRCVHQVVGRRPVGDQQMVFGLLVATGRDQQNDLTFVGRDRSPTFADQRVSYQRVPATKATGRRQQTAILSTGWCNPTPFQHYIVDLARIYKQPKINNCEMNVFQQLSVLAFRCFFATLFHWTCELSFQLAPFFKESFAPFPNASL